MRCTCNIHRNPQTTCGLHLHWKSMYLKRKRSWSPFFSLVCPCLWRQIAIFASTYSIWLPDKCNIDSFNRRIECQILQESVWRQRSTLWMCLQPRIGGSVSEVLPKSLQIFFRKVNLEEYTCVKIFMLFSRCKSLPLRDYLRWAIGVCWRRDQQPWFRWQFAILWKIMCLYCATGISIMPSCVVRMHVRISQYFLIISSLSSDRSSLSRPGEDLFAADRQYHQHQHIPADSPGNWRGRYRTALQRRNSP